MTSLLDNELVRKYFGCRAVCTEAHFINVGYDEHEWCMSSRILESMQQPIKKGDRYLLANFDGSVSEEIGGGLTDYFHAYCLRLPSQFQTEKLTFDPRLAEEMEDFKWCGYDQKEMRSMRDFALSQGWKPPPAPVDEVEQKIKDIMDCIKFHYPSKSCWDKCIDLHELVTLARKGS